MSDINEKTIFKNSKLVDDVSLIKVVVIKSKFIDQMESWWDEKPLDWQNIEFIGQTSYWVVFRVGGKIWKIHHMKLKDKIQTALMMSPDDPKIKRDYDIVMKEVESIVASIPQMFME